MSAGSQRVGIRGVRPLILRDEKKRVHILPARQAWSTLYGTLPQSTWKTLCKADGATSSTWLPVKRLSRFAVPRWRKFAGICTPKSEMEALFGKEAVLGSQASSPSDDDLPRVPPPQRPSEDDSGEEEVDLWEDTALGLRTSGYLLPRLWNSHIIQVAHQAEVHGVELKLQSGSAELFAFARLAAAFLADKRTLRKPLLEVSLQREDFRFISLLCGDLRKRQESRELYLELEEDVKLLTAGERYLISKLGRARHAPTLISTLVLLCGLDHFRRIPSFVLNGHKHVQRAFLNTLDRIERYKSCPNGVYGPTTLYYVPAAVAAGISYLWTERKKESQSIFFASPYNVGPKSFVQLVLSREDPVDRSTHRTSGFGNLPSVKDPYAYALEAVGSDHFLDAVSHVPLRRYVDAAAARQAEAEDEKASSGEESGAEVVPAESGKATCAHL